MSTTVTILAATHELEPSAPTTLRGAWLWLARAAWLLILAASLVGFFALVPINLVKISDDWQIEGMARFLGLDRLSLAYTTFSFAILASRYLVLLFFYAVAFWIVWHKSNDWMAVYVSATLLLVPVSSHFGGYSDIYYLYPPPWNQVLHSLDFLLSVLGILLMLNLFYLFPDGRFVPRVTRWFALALSLSFAGPLAAEFFHLTNIDESLWVTYLIVIAAAMFAGAAAQVYRYRRVSNALQRAQTRWVVLGSIGVVIGMLLAFALQAFDQTMLGALQLPLGILIPTLLPISFAIAMTRHGLWQSDPFLNRALVYGSLTAISVMAYVAIVAALSEVLRVHDNFLVSAISTGIIALLFQPLRARLQRSINRLMYGERDDPFAVLNRFGAQLENSLTPDAALPLIVETIGKTLRVPYVAIMLLAENGIHNTEHGKATNDVIALPLRHQNETVGELKIARRAPNEKFSAADLQLVENLARQAGAVVYTARLHAALQRSRERIIAEREQERRRLRRDLHDGLGPTLASQALKLDAALDLIHGEDAANVSARGILQDIKTQMQATVAEIRLIVYELRPPALDDLGLVGALRAHLGKSNGPSGPVLTLDAPPELPPLAAALQVNAYRIVIEAVTNAVRHAHAQTCHVKIARDANALRLEIRDDGVGFDPARQRGVGLHAMQERAAEVGGMCEIESAIGKGTSVVARLPLGTGGDLNAARAVAEI